MKRFPIGIILTLWLAVLGQAQAGMTVITLTDMARARFDALSFFLVAYFVIGPNSTLPIYVQAMCC